MGFFILVLGFSQFWWDWAGEVSVIYGRDEGARWMERDELTKDRIE